MRKYLQLGERLKELRGDLSQEEFAKKIGVSHKGYQRYESGERVPHPYVLSKIAVLYDTTVDWILTGNLASSETIIGEWEKGTYYLEYCFEELGGIKSRMLKFKLTYAKEKATEEEIENIEKILEDKNILMDLMKEGFEGNIWDIRKIKHFEQISQPSPLYSIFRQIEKMFNKGEKAKIDAIKTLLTAFESNKDDDRAKINVFKVLVAVFESDLEK
jgi:transcriptional regulator with XRE-family HTH domain